MKKQHNKTHLGLLVKVETKNKIREIARREERSMSFVVEKILLRGVETLNKVLA